MHKYSKHIIDLRDKIPGSHLHQRSEHVLSKNSHDIRVERKPLAPQRVSNEYANIESKRPVVQHSNIQPKTLSPVSSFPEREKRESFLGSIFIQIKSAMQFAVLTSVIFVILFGLSNFTAYKEILNYWYQTEVIKADKEDTALDKVITPLEEQDVKDIVLNKGKVSYINFQVRPSDDRIYIPKINKNLPIVQPSDQNLIAQNWDALEEDIQAGLRQGVVHYPNTANPGQIGNVFLTAHSSWYPNDPLPYGLSSAFALISQLVAGDDIYIFDNGEMYIYKVRDKFVVKPTNVEVLDQPTDKREMTLMTCTPVGTTLNRMIIKLDLVYPSYGDDSDVTPTTPNMYSNGRLQA